jgi:nitrous-oxide reductase
LWKFDRAAGRIDMKKSFAIELPPYWQDLFDAGKLTSEGWIFGNSINTEMATGGIEDGNPPFEAGASQRDTDYMHIINLKAAEAAYQAGKTKMVNGFPVIPLDVAKDGILFFAPEPKSPHGCDVTPNGKYIVVAGKLDPHVSVYSFEKIMATIEAKKWTPDPFGVPILDQDSVTEARIEVGLGPLHTQFDDKGYAYTSLFLDTAVARWTLGGEYADKHPEPAWTLVGKTPTQYNIGHLAAAEGDTVSPDGKYLVALNKWSVDRFFPTGPLLPQNLQLMDISATGTTMPVIYDGAMGIGEPHYAQIIKADKLKPWTVYPDVGWNPATQSKDPTAPVAGGEKIVRSGSRVDVYQTAIRSHFNPEHVDVKKGDHVFWHITNLERTQDATHGFAIPGYNINLSLEAGETQTVEFVADRAGTYPFYCTEFCSALHLEMQGYFLVKPKGYKAAAAGAAKAEYTKADYDKQYNTNIETQKVIDGVVAWIVSTNFKDFPDAVALVEDATDQLKAAEEPKKKMEEAAKKNDWQNATLWAGQWWQYQVKAADIGLRAKKYLEEKGAKKVK